MAGHFADILKSSQGVKIFFTDILQIFCGYFEKLSGGQDIIFRIFPDILQIFWKALRVFADILNSNPDILQIFCGYFADILQIFFRLLGSGYFADILDRIFCGYSQIFCGYFGCHFEADISRIFFRLTKMLPSDYRKWQLQDKRLRQRHHARCD